MPSKATIPCSTGCGKLMWDSSTTAATPICRECRAKSPVHGETRYRRYGCRCEICKEAVAKAQREWVARYQSRTGERYRNNFAQAPDTFRIPDTVRYSIYERDEWVCQLCAEPVDSALLPNDRWSATLDHIIPQSLSDSPDHSESNLRLAHRSCNSSRGNSLTDAA